MFAHKAAVTCPDVVTAGHGTQCVFMVDNLQERMFSLFICPCEQQTDMCTDTHVYSYQVDEPVC